MSFKFWATFQGNQTMAKTIMPKLLFILAVSSTDLVGHENYWKVLAEVSYQTLKDQRGFDVEKPVFKPNIKLLAGKKIKLRGYIIPMNELSGKKSFMFSALPFSTCYFCGGAGPETVIEVDAVSSITFSNEPMIPRRDFNSE